MYILFLPHKYVPDVLYHVFIDLDWGTRRGHQFELFLMGATFYFYFQGLEINSKLDLR